MQWTKHTQKEAWAPGVRKGRGYPGPWGIFFIWADVRSGVLQTERLKKWWMWAFVRKWLLHDGLHFLGGQTLPLGYFLPPDQQHRIKPEQSHCTQGTKCPGPQHFWGQRIFMTLLLLTPPLKCGTVMETAGLFIHKEPRKTHAVWAVWVTNHSSDPWG